MFIFLYNLMDMIHMFRLSQIMFEYHCAPKHEFHTCASQGRDSDANEYRISSASQNEIRQYYVILMADADV